LGELNYPQHLPAPVSKVDIQVDRWYNLGITIRYGVSWMEWQCQPVP